MNPQDIPNLGNIDPEKIKSSLQSEGFNAWLKQKTGSSVEEMFAGVDVDDFVNTMKEAAIRAQAEASDDSEGK